MVLGITLLVRRPSGVRFEQPALAQSALYFSLVTPA